MVFFSLPSLRGHLNSWVVDVSMFQVPAWSSDSDDEGTFYLATEPGAAIREGWYDLEVQATRHGSSAHKQRKDDDLSRWTSSRKETHHVLPVDEDSSAARSMGGTKSSAKRSQGGTSSKHSATRSGGGNRAHSSHHGGHAKSRSAGGGSAADSRHVRDRTSAVRGNNGADEGHRTHHLNGI